VPRFAYVANNTDNSVSIYAVNASTGQLRHNGYVATEVAPRSVTVDPTGKFAYVANDGSSSVSAYTINATTGALTSVGLSVAAGLNPYSVTVDPTGKFAYVANVTSDNVSAYRINATSGELTPVACVGICSGINFPAGDSPISVTVAPSGRFAYVVNSISASVWVYAIDSATGALSSVGAPVLTGGSNSRSITVAPSGSFAYVTNAGPGNGSISAYRVDATTGALSQIVCVGSCSGANYYAGNGPSSVTVDPSGRYAYAANYNTYDVSVFRINTSSGALTSLGTVAAGSGPNSVIVDPSGKFAYVANFISANVSAYSIDTTTGFLTPLPTVAGRSGNLSMAMTKGTTAVNYTPKFAYATSYGNNNVSAYTVNAGTGALTSIGASPAAGSGAYAVVVDPTGKFVYVANSVSANISAYAINAAGALAAVSGSPFAAGSSNYSITVAPTGRFAYVVNNGPDTVWIYAINPTNGALTHNAALDVVTSVNPVSITIDPTGRFAFVANKDAPGTVSAYTINETTGALTQVACAGGALVCSGNDFRTDANFPVSVTVDPTGKFVYVANNNPSGTVSAFTIDGANGSLTAMAGSPFSAGNTPSSVTVDPSGKFAYVTNEISDDVSAYSVDATSGVLSQILCGGGAACNPLNGNNYLAGDRPMSVAFDASGKFAYVAHRNAATVWTYRLDPATGALSKVDSVSAPSTFSVTTTGTIQ
jgi:6-phosphogluconolactonase (cycloisomerase 2 family)